jgi:hypothetical protein
MNKFKSWLYLGESSATRCLRQPNHAIFSNLPFELRRQIYQIILDITPLHVYRKDKQNDYAIVLACHQIFEEALPIYRPFMEKLLPQLDDEIAAQHEEMSHIIGLGPVQAMYLCLDRKEQIEKQLRLLEKIERMGGNSRA